jgi:hypothetical protein
MQTALLTDPLMSLKALPLQRGHLTSIGFLLSPLACASPFVQMGCDTDGGKIQLQAR